MTFEMGKPFPLKHWNFFSFPVYPTGVASSSQLPTQSELKNALSAM